MRLLWGQIFKKNFVDILNDTYNRYIKLNRSEAQDNMTMK